MEKLALDLSSKKVFLVGAKDNAFSQLISNLGTEVVYVQSTYKEVISDYNNYINKLQISNSKFMIEYLNIIGILDNKSPLLRLLKMDKLRKYLDV